MSNLVTCPVCSGNNEAQCTQHPTSFDGKAFDCERCGKFTISGTVLDDNNNFRGSALSDVERVCLSQRLRMSQSQSEPPFVHSDWLKGFREKTKLPSPLHQAKKLIEIVGDHVSAQGKALDQLPQSGYGEIGFFDRNAFRLLFEDLFAKGTMSGNVTPDTFDGYGHPTELNLTLSGWTEYQTLKSGMSPGLYGFLAMKFGDDILEKFAKEHLKPHVMEKLGYEVIDIRDVSKAGIIDNLMREQIRDSAFVIADLSHDNSGAYWEAGYAEGLGKPVIYICEKEKFKESQTHFDTNHCTTVMWSYESPNEFQQELIATLRRSLALF